MTLQVITATYWSRWRPFLQKWGWVLCLMAVMLVHGFFRLSALDKTPFTFDQEMVAQRALSIVRGDPTLIGTRVGVYALYTAPWYLYATASFFAVLGHHPLINALQAYLWTLLALVWLFMWVRHRYGLLAATNSGFIFAVAPFILHFDRVPWNDNPLLFASLLVTTATISLVEVDRPRWYHGLWLGVGTAIGISSHFMGGILIACSLLFLLMYRKWRWSWLATLAATIAITIAPIGLFELKNNFLNTRGMLALFHTTRVADAAIPTFKQGLLWRGYDQLMSAWRSVGSLIAWGEHLRWWQPWIGALTTLWLFRCVRRDKAAQWLALLSLVSVTALSLYTGAKPEYYYLILMPGFVTLIGLLLTRIIQRQSYGLWILVMLLLAGLLIQANTIPAQRHFDALRYRLDVLQAIADHSQGRPVRLEYDMDPAWIFGYGYLATEVVGLQLDDKSDLTYRIGSRPQTNWVADQHFDNISLLLARPLCHY
jgi:hypothetical protein